MLKKIDIAVCRQSGQGWVDCASTKLDLLATLAVAVEHQVRIEVEN